MVIGHYNKELIHYNISSKTFYTGEYVIEGLPLNNWKSVKKENLSLTENSGCIYTKTHKLILRSTTDSSVVAYFVHYNGHTFSQCKYLKILKRKII